MNKMQKFWTYFTGFPEEWCWENKATLLLLCGEPIATKMLISKAINGRTAELTSLITYFCVVSWIWIHTIPYEFTVIYWIIWCPLPNVRINETNHRCGQGKLSISSNILKFEHLFPFIAIKGSNSFGQGYPFLVVILF